MAEAMNMRITSPEGMLLRTEGKYCDKDISFDVALEDVTVTPTEEKQTINATSGNAGIGTLTVNRIPEKYVIPSGKVTLSTNGSHDVSGKAIAVVNVPDNPLPIEIATEEEMTALLETAEIGAVYKYTGETTDTYENGALYVVEAVSE